MENLKISKEDEQLLTEWRVYFDKSNGYYKCSRLGQTTYLHRVIAGAKKGQVVDHIDRDKRNNTRENLRIVSQSINGYNREVNNPLGRGVYFDKFGNRYRACLSVGNRTLKLGSFKDARQAKEAYNVKAKEIYGELAYQHSL